MGFPSTLTFTLAADAFKSVAYNTAAIIIVLQNLFNLQHTSNHFFHSNLPAYSGSMINVFLPLSIFIMVLFIFPNYIGYIMVKYPITA